MRAVRGAAVAVVNVARVDVAQPRILRDPAGADPTATLLMHTLIELVAARVERPRDSETEPDLKSGEEAA